MHFKFEHEFDLDAASYWDLFFSEDYNKDLYAELKMKDRKVLEQKEEGGVLRRTVKLVPGKEVPAIFKSIVSDMSYTEKNVYRKERSEMEVVVEPALMKDKFDLRAVYSVKPLGDKKVRRTFEGDVNIKIMLIGGKMEKYMVDELRESYETAARVTRKWIEKRKAAAGA